MTASDRLDILPPPQAPANLLADLFEEAAPKDPRQVELMKKLAQKPSDRFNLVSARLSDDQSAEVRSAREMGRRIAQNGVDEAARPELVAMGGTEVASKLMAPGTVSPQDMSAALYGDMGHYYFGGDQNAFEEVSLEKQTDEVAERIAMREDKVVATQAMLLGIAEAQMEQGDTMSAMQQMQAARLDTRRIPPWFMQSVETHLSGVVERMPTMTEADLSLLDQIAVETMRYPSTSGQVDTVSPLSSLHGNDFLARVTHEVRTHRERIGEEARREARRKEYVRIFKANAAQSFDSADSSVQAQIARLIESNYGSGTLALRDACPHYLGLAIMNDDDVSTLMRRDAMGELNGMVRFFRLISDPDFISRSAVMLADQANPGHNLYCDEGMRRFSDMSPQEATAAVERMIRRDISGAAIGMLRGTMLYQSDRTDGSYSRGNLPALRRSVLKEVMMAIGGGKAESLMRATGSDEELRAQEFTDVQIQAKRAMEEFRVSINENSNALTEFKAIFVPEIRKADMEYQSGEQKRAQERAVFIEAKDAAHHSLDFLQQVSDTLTDDLTRLRTSSGLSYIGITELPNYLSISGDGKDRHLVLNTSQRDRLTARVAELDRQLAGDVPDATRYSLENDRMELTTRLQFYNQVEAQLAEFNKKRKTSFGLLGGGSSFYPVEALRSSDKIPPSNVDEVLDALTRKTQGRYDQKSIYDQVNEIQTRYDELMRSGKGTTEDLKRLQQMSDALAAEMQALHQGADQAVISAQVRGAISIFSIMGVLTTLSIQNGPYKGLIKR